MSNTLSFTVVTYNNEDRIKNLIENIQKAVTKDQTATIFVVDNGSVDLTVKEVGNLQKDYPNIRLIQSENKGFGAGHNAVIPYLTSDYHVVVNPDITIPSSKELGKMIDYMNKHSEVGLLSPLILNVDGSIQKLFKRNPTVLDLGIRFISPKLMKKRQDWFVRENSGYKNAARIEYASGSFMFFRTSVFKELNGFDERYFMYLEDADITRRVNEFSEAIFLPDSFVIHEWQRASHKKIKYTLVTVDSMIKYFNKWGWKAW